MSLNHAPTSVSSRSVLLMNGSSINWWNLGLFDTSFVRLHACVCVRVCVRVCDGPSVNEVSKLQRNGGGVRNARGFSLHN